jgi:TonB family protein
MTSSVGRESKEAAPNAFLGEKTRVVDRETVNSKRVIEMGKASAPAKALTQAQSKDQAHQPKPKGESDMKKSTLSNLGLAILPDSRRKGASEELAQDKPQWANVGALPQDYVEGIKESDRTALNTREYLYFGYHQRIRQRLELEWTRMLREVLLKFYKGGRQLASDMEYTTRLLVTLNPQGEITRVKVQSMSGTQELDDVAVAAFNKAGPFPNPPKGLVKNGEVEVPWELKLRS